MWHTHESVVANQCSALYCVHAFSLSRSLPPSLTPSLPPSLLLLSHLQIEIRVEAIGVTAVGVEQRVEFLHSYQKTKRLLETLRTTPSPPVLVFCNTIHTVDQVAALLHREQFHVAALHSERDPAIRFQIMDALLNGGVDVLVTTDLASRGIDVPGITHIINFDMPLSIED